MTVSCVGGRRQRLVSDSVYHMLNDAITDLGWFTMSQLTIPVTFRTESIGLEEEIQLNTMVLSETGTLDQDAELGSNLGEITTTFYVDFYAENEAVGKAMAHDLRDILRGRMASIGRNRQTVRVYDWDLAVPVHIFTCEVEDVVVDQARDYPKPWQKNWWACRFDLIDTYSGDDSGTGEDSGTFGSGTFGG